MKLLDPLWAEISRHVEKSCKAGDACQQMDTRAERLPHFTPVVMPAYVLVTVHGSASCSELSRNRATGTKMATASAAAPGRFRIGGRIPVLLIVDKVDPSFELVGILRSQEKLT